MCQALHAVGHVLGKVENSFDGAGGDFEAAGLKSIG
jgi:hypothetical protein